MILKVLAWIYRRTGYYPNYAAAKCLDQLDWEGIEEFLKENPEYSLRNASGVFIGIWQAEHRFARKWNINKELQKLRKKHLKKKR